LKFPGHRETRRLEGLPGSPVMYLSLKSNNESGLVFVLVSAPFFGELVSVLFGDEIVLYLGRLDGALPGTKWIDVNHLIPCKVRSVSDMFVLSIVEYSC